MLGVVSAEGQAAAALGRGALLRVCERAQDRETEFWFRAHRNGITFGFSARGMVGGAGAVSPGVGIAGGADAWDALTLEYGEL